MAYLIDEIIFWLFFAAAFGFLIGWLLRDQFIQNEKINEPAVDASVSLAEKITVPQRPVKTSANDDLKKLKGIGLYIENKLNSMSIRTFLQISEQIPKRIEDSPGQVGAFHARIVRDKWIEQAQKLVKNKN